MLQEISGVGALGASLPVWSLPVRPAVPRITAAASGGTAGGATGDRPAAGSARAARPVTWELPERFTLAGPSPAFQASLLEMDRDFQRLIARIEATRAKAEADRVFGRAAPAAPAEPAVAPAKKGGTPPAPEPASAQAPAIPASATDGAPPPAIRRAA